ncbi:MAG: 50S ribosomal protein L4 [archaeon]
MKATIKSTDGTGSEEIKFPTQFSEEVRPDLIKRAVLAIKSHRRQPYGTDPEAGMRHSAKLSRRRRDYKTSYGHGISRVPRKIMSHSGTRFNWVGAEAPNTVGGRRSHPPKSQKIFDQKINIKERRKAIRSALAASIIKELVEKRGHKVTDYPLVIDDSIENISKTKEIIELLTKLGLENELERIGERKIRAGKGKLRGRRYKVTKGPLFVVSKKCSLIAAAKNITGVDIEAVDSLNVELLAPNGDYGRLTIYTKSAIQRIGNEMLFTDNIKKADEIKKIVTTKRAKKETE